MTLDDAPVLVAGRNFGCGSSREHAVWAIQQAGYKAVIAPSFADIFYTNATKNGLLPIALPEEDVEGAHGGRGVPDRPARRSWSTFGGRVVHFDIDPEIKRRLLNGLDDIAITLSDGAAIDTYERRRAWPAPSTTAL